MTMTRPCDHEGRDWRERSASRGALKIACKPPEAWTRQGRAPYRCRRERGPASALTVVSGLQAWEAICSHCFTSCEL